MELVLSCRAVSRAVTPELWADAGSEGGTEQRAGGVLSQAQAGACQAGLCCERGDLQPGETELASPGARQLHTDGLQALLTAGLHQARHYGHLGVPGPSPRADDDHGGGGPHDDPGGGGADVGLVVRDDEAGQLEVELSSRPGPGGPGSSITDGLV